MPLYLTGGGDQDAFRNLDRFFLEGLSKGSSILVIPLALDEDDYEDALERVEECFSGAKVASIVMCEDVNKVSFDELKEFDAVFIEGGNTFQLIEAVRQSSFFDFLEKYLAEGGRIYADSAGAIVLGAHVKTAFLGDEADEDFQKLQDYRGLGLIQSWAIHCHHEIDDHDGLQDLMYETGTPIMALAEPCAVFIQGSELKVFGTAALEVYTFTGKQVFAPGSSVNLEEIQG